MSSMGYFRHHLQDISGTAYPNAFWVLPPWRSSGLLDRDTPECRSRMLAVNIFAVLIATVDPFFYFIRRGCYVLIHGVVSIAIVVAITLVPNVLKFASNHFPSQIQETRRPRQ
jgi:hypothetical protein